MRISPVAKQAACFVSVLKRCASPEICGEQLHAVHYTWAWPLRGRGDLLQNCGPFLPSVTQKKRPSLPLAIRLSIKESPSPSWLVFFCCSREPAPNHSLFSIHPAISHDGLLLVHFRPPFDYSLQPPPGDSFPHPGALCAPPSNTPLPSSCPAYYHIFSRGVFLNHIASCKCSVLLVLKWLLLAACNMQSWKPVANTSKVWRVQPWRPSPKLCC